MTTTQGFLHAAEVLYLELSRFKANLKQLINRYSINDRYICQYFSLQAKSLSNVPDRQTNESKIFRDSDSMWLTV